MNELQDCILGDLVEFQRGYDLPKDSFVKGEYPVQSSNGILGYHNEYKVKAPGITIGRSGTVGIPHLITKNFFPHNTALYVKDFKGNNVHYIYYLLKNLKLNEYKTGSGVPTMNRNHLHPLKIKAFTDSKYQQSIAAVLSALDKKIALNKQINARLEEMAKTLYDYWFVQFDFPDASGKPYKSSGGEMVFDETLKREIPKGWVVKKLKDAMQIVRGASPRPIDDFLSDNGIPWIKISDATATSTPFIFKTKEFIKSNGKQYSRYLYPNTLILSNSATPGIPRIVELECCVHDGWLIIENLKNSLFNEFMYFYFLNFKEKIMNLGSGSIFKNLKTEYIKELDLIIPNKETLENAKTIFSDVFKKIKNTQKQNHHLIQLRDFLLPMLMNGQVSVAE